MSRIVKDHFVSLIRMYNAKLDIFSVRLEPTSTFCNAKAFTNK